MTQDFVKFRVRAALAHSESFLAFKFHNLISMPGPQTRIVLFRVIGYH